MRRAPRIPDRLAGFAPHALAARLRELGAAPGAADRGVRLALKAAFAGDRGHNEHEGHCASLDADALQRAGVGRAATAELLRLALAPSLEVAEEAPAHDGTIRLLLRTWDGQLLESVLIPGPDRTTLCVSSQAGCARACRFCETGRLGLVRQLDAAEIVDQVRVARALWAARAPSAPPVSNLVLMGMGEPFDNLGEVLPALALLTDDRAFALAPSRVTVSTVGVADKLEAFFAGTKARLAVSINAPDDARRNAIMPVGQRFSLAALRAELVRTLPKGRRLLVEYALFHDFNDSANDAKLLAEWVADLPARVNVIPANPGPDPALRTPPPERVDAFVAALASHGVRVLVRRPRGRDVGGACGQLAGARRELISLHRRASDDAGRAPA